MTLVTHGLAGELKDDGIGCNTLWPRTSVSTAAVQNILGGDFAMANSRTPAILADAAHVILTSDSKLTTDNFFIDDEVLISNGLNLGELERLYQPAGVKSHNLISDFMI